MHACKAVCKSTAGQDETCKVSSPQRRSFASDRNASRIGQHGRREGRHTGFCWRLSCMSPMWNPCLARYTGTNCTICQSDNVTTAASIRTLENFLRAVQNAHLSGMVSGRTAITIADVVCTMRWVALTTPGRLGSAEAGLTVDAFMLCNHTSEVIRSVCIGVRTAVRKA